VIRHPEVRPFAGAVGDLELELVQPAARHAAALVERVHDLGLSAVVTSPRLRCAAVATPLATTLAVPLVVEPRLREIEHGQWTGRSWDELAAWDAQRFRYWMEHWIESAPPGGESAVALAERVRAALCDNRVARDRALWITHRGVVQALHVLHGLPWPEAAQRPAPTLERPDALVELRHHAGVVRSWRPVGTGRDLTETSG
jgi:alpha-ribazole phosphatase